tara:strand:+ start:5178 stop:6488 length:1311 start_codon:yes stop_codon:yes gene_type:complete
MAIFKQFNTNEVVVAPFNANKRFAFSGYEITASNVGIEYYQTRQGPYKSGSFPTGFTSITDGVLVFNSIKQLYYSNYLTSSTGDEVSTGSLIPGAQPEYDEEIGIITGPRYENYLQTSLTQSRYFSQFDSQTNTIGPSVISIPSKLFGEQIPPTCFQFEYTSSLNYTRSLVTDDGEGNLMVTYNNGEARPGVLDPTLQEKIGDIFYSQGMAVFTGPDSGSLSIFPRLMGVGATLNNNTYSSSIQFSSSLQIRENQYKCVVRDNEYSYTTNPSALRPLGELNRTPNQLSGSIVVSTFNDGGSVGVYELPLINSSGFGGSGGSVNVTIASDGTVSDITVVNVGKGYSPNETYGINLSSTGGVGVIGLDLTLSDVTGIGTQNTNETYYDFATGSYFSPYVTTIGLYNESYQLVAVGKLSQPIPISLYVDTTFVVNFDTW